MERKAITFYREWYDSLQELDTDERLAAYEAIFRYAFEGVEPTDKLIRIATKLIIAEIDSEDERMEVIRQKRSEAGKKHKGNQYSNGTNVPTVEQMEQTEQVFQNGTNGTSVPKMEQNGTNGTNDFKETENEKENKEEIPPTPPIEEIKEKDKEKEKFSANSKEFVLNQRFNEKFSTTACACTREDEENFSLSEKPDGMTSISYDFIREFWNEQMQGKAIPQIQQMTESRRKNINARLREKFSFEDIKQVIINASQSDFLNGKNSKGWTADFNWVFRPTNFPKVLEGNYTNRQPQQINDYGTDATSGGYISRYEQQKRERAEREADTYRLMQQIAASDGGEPLPPLGEQGYVYS